MYEQHAVTSSVVKKMGPIMFCATPEVPSLNLTAKAPENRPGLGKDRIPTIHFQVRTVSFREGIILIFKDSKAS